MTTLPLRVCSSMKYRHAAGVALATLALALGGCMGNRYRVADLPAEFAAKPSVNVDEIKLTRLAHYSVNSELIDRGDVLEVTIVTDLSNLDELTAPVRVNESGMAHVPQVGQVALAGLEMEDAEQAIAATAISLGKFKNPHVTVTMKRQRTNRITVIGAVEEPGVFELPRGACSLLAALVSAGGLTEDAGPEVEIRRSVLQQAVPDVIQSAPLLAGEAGNVHLTSHEKTVAGGVPGPLITRINLAKAAAEGSGGGHLHDGDVVMVTKRKPKPVYVIGLVKNPGEYELPPHQDMRVLDALARAGERTIQVADTVLVIRRVPGREEPVYIQVSIREAKSKGNANIILAPGDIVSVEETPATVVVRTITDVIRVSVGGGFTVF